MRSTRQRQIAETKDIEEYARKTAGADFNLEPYDRFYYSAKMKKELLNISEDEVKPYFNVDSVLINGVFYAARPRLRTHLQGAYRHSPLSS
ncbi:M3 family metallopeptidase [Prevotella communis]|uniref:M3 family metallopeptidase n=1 Tax=Prevotella communis TaxID=2913614 RepID=UPI0032AFF364